MPADHGDELNHGQQARAEAGTYLAGSGVPDREGDTAIITPVPVRGRIGVASSMGITMVPAGFGTQ